jgi:hypothetical protein
VGPRFLLFHLSLRFGFCTSLLTVVVSNMDSSVIGSADVLIGMTLHLLEGGA